MNPTIVGAHLHLNPVLVRAVLLVGHQLFGIWGLLLGVPSVTCALSYAIQPDEIGRKKKAEGRACEARRAPRWGFARGGAFAFEGLAPGRYRLSCRTYDEEFRLSGEAEVAIAAAERETRAELRLSLSRRGR